LATFNYTDPNTLEDYLVININFAHIKLSEYYVKLNDTPIYYVAIIFYLYYKYFLTYM
ncbi:hypothetical protein BU23DRAFT_450241, partial [Bimuria novae-zelandiae CBS 107.79]